MRRVLVLGGTGWLGGRIARLAAEGGAEVTVLARGGTPPPTAARLVVGDRAHPDAYAGLDGDWDEIVDVTTDPGHVVGALDALADRAPHWTFVSTISVYARNDVPGADESAELVEPVDLEQYPDAKAAAEQHARDRLGDRLLVVRPGLIVGAGDRTGRFGYWPARFARGGRVLVPPTAGRHVQVIDVGDLAAYVVLAGSAGVTGVVNAVGDAAPFAEVLAACARAADFDGELVERDEEWLLARDVAHWAGPRSLPLWLPPTHVGMMARSNARFHATGGTLRPLAETLAEVLADERARGLDRERPAGLALEEERGLLA